MDRKAGQPTDESSTTEESTRPEVRRPYRTPRLRHLGSVRELTLGATMGAFGDGGTGMMTTPM